MLKCFSLALLATFISSFDLAWGQKDQSIVPSFIFTADDGSILIEDGDSFWMGNHKVRLYGIDTVETAQVCEAKNRSVDCHKLTMEYVTPLFHHPRLKCQPLMGKFKKPWIQDGRYISICSIDGEELNRKMVYDGWALNYQRIGGNAYEDIESIAKIAKRGLHEFDFSRPIVARRKPDNCSIPSSGSK